MWRRANPEMFISVAIVPLWAFSTTHHYTNADAGLAVNECFPFIYHAGKDNVSSVKEKILICYLCCWLAVPAGSALLFIELSLGLAAWAVKAVICTRHCPVRVCLYNHACTHMCLNACPCVLDPALYMQGWLSAHHTGMFFFSLHSIFFSLNLCNPADLVTQHFCCKKKHSLHNKMQCISN